jgi:hypothetical protein
MFIGLDRLADDASQAFRAQHPELLAFMFASGKSEGYLRDVFGAHLNRNLLQSGFEHVTREWKKHDLAVMDGDRPTVLVEGKSWISHDAYRKSKLITDKQSIFAGALTDVKKLIKAKRKYPEVEIYISTVVFGINTDAVIDYEMFNITYGDSHHLGLKKAGSFDELVSVARGNTTRLHELFGPTRRFPLEVGRYKGMQIEADFYLTEVTNDLESIEQVLQFQSFSFIK